MRNQMQSHYENMFIYLSFGSLPVYKTDKNSTCRTDVEEMNQLNEYTISRTRK